VSGAAESEAGRPQVDGESAVTLETMEGLSELLPEHRRLVGLLVVLLGLDGDSLAAAAAELGAAANERRQRAAREIGKLREGAELAERQLVAAFRRLPEDERCWLRDFAVAVAEGDEDVAVATALRLIKTACGRRQADREARRQRIVEEAQRARLEGGGEQP
jgi:hypothetical protein